MYAGVEGEEFHCTISEYCRTRIFEFPGIDFHPKGEEPHHTMYVSSCINACVTSNLVDYFANSASSKHYAISPRSESEYWLTGLPGQAAISVNYSCRLTMLTLGGSVYGTSFPTGGVDIPRARLAGWPMLIRGPIGRTGIA